MSYRKAEGLAVYEARDKQLGNRRLVFDAVEFVGRLARLVPPPRKNLVRYYGALGPNSTLRPLVSEAARALSADGPVAAARRAVRKAGEALSASARAWANCLSRVFEADPLICTRCGDRLVPMAAILADKQIVRVLAHLGLPRDFPKLAPARSPPFPSAGESQAAPDPGPSENDWIPPDEV